MDKPKNIEQYKDWLKSQHGISLSEKNENYYNSVAVRVKSDFEKSEFWLRLQSELQNLNQRYYIDTGYYLFTTNTPPTLVIKPYSSLLLKSFRKNILNNKDWPKAPDNGWVLPENWLTNTNDIVRTYFVTKYLDGVEFLCNAVSKIANELGLDCKVDFEAKDDGYYAAHFYVYIEYDVPTESWESVKLKIPVEIQITTQLQEVIKNLLHSYYEKKRTTSTPVGVKWQWDYRSNEFSANYLGHILHYVEGMIMEVREKKMNGE
jgi:ppGpp synthetase/RelA/SpoT-type nucleotidyltranferase